MQQTNLTNPLSLFAAYGIEIEYMIVDSQTLEICPFTDKLFHKIAGKIENEIERGDIALNNELALHVLELKTNGPKQDLSQIADSFHQELVAINQLLAPENKVLLPSAMHPWTKVDAIQLWPHDDKVIYNTYHEIFNCQGHGWSNLQSTHLNLPFANEDEFVKLHQAIRLVLPIIPAIAASSPFCEGVSSGYQCARMVHYEQNQKKIPNITGFVVPESVTTQDEYFTKILNPMYDAIKDYDKNHVLRYEWLNSRGAIARFERSAIEIRVIDSQESALADLAIINAIVAVLKRIIKGDSRYVTDAIDERQLKQIMDSCVLHGMSALIDNAQYLKQLGLQPQSNMDARAVWSELITLEQTQIEKPFHQPLEHMLKHGSLSERLAKSLPDTFTVSDLKDVYSKLIQCLKQNTLYAYK